MKKLNKLEEELNKNNKDISPVVIDPELLPSDGSKNANMIRRLAAALDCSSEYCILNSPEVKEVLGENIVNKERKRLKVKGPRLTNVGTDGERHAYRTLLKWSEVFDFFYPLPHILISKKRGIKI